MKALGKQLRNFWHASLRTRTLTFISVITAIMLLMSGTFLLSHLANELYESRRAQILEDSARATEVAQSVIDTSDANDRGSLSALMTSVRRAVQETSSSDQIYVRRQPYQVASTQAPADFFTDEQVVSVITEDLLASLKGGLSPQFWQPVSLTDDTGIVTPGIVVGTSIVFPAGAGTYDLFLGYSFADIEETLAFITQALLITTVFLFALIAALVWTFTRIVFRPIRDAADASRRLASGDDSARMSLQNDKYFDILSENFNTMAETLQARIGELARLSEMQRRFVSDVSHELRTPLTTIRLASELLNVDADSASPSQVRATQVLGIQIDRFEQLLTDLLEISRYDADQVVLVTELVNFATLAEEVAEDLRPLYNGVIEVRMLDSSAIVPADPLRIRRILANLIGNAIEYGEGLPIVVTIDANASAVSVGVRDHGVGMPPESSEHVFDRFWRADPARKRTLGGTGLGLAIAQADAAVHGGRIELWSRLGEGSHFLLTIPVLAAVRSVVSPIALVPSDAENHIVQDD